MSSQNVKVKYFIPKLPKDFFETMSMIFNYQKIDDVKKLYEKIEEILANYAPRIIKTKKETIGVIPMMWEKILYLKLIIIENDSRQIYSTNININNFDLSRNKINFILEKINNITSSSKNVSIDLEKEFYQNDMLQNFKTENFVLLKNNKITYNARGLFFNFMREYFDEFLEKIEVPFFIKATKNAFYKKEIYESAYADSKFEIHSEKNNIYYNITIDDQELLEEYRKKEEDLKFYKKGSNVYKISTKDEWNNFKKENLTHVINSIVNKEISRQMDLFLKELKKDINIEILNLSTFMNNISQEIEESEKNTYIKIYNWIISNNDQKKMVRRRQAIRSLGLIIPILLLYGKDSVIYEITDIVDNEQNLNEYIERKTNLSKKAIKSLATCNNEHTLYQIFNNFRYLNNVDNDSIPYTVNTNNDELWLELYLIIREINKIKRDLNVENTFFEKDISEIIDSLKYKNWMSKKTVGKIGNSLVYNIEHIHDIIYLIKIELIEPYILKKYKLDLSMNEIYLKLNECTKIEYKYKLKGKNDIEPEDSDKIFRSSSYREMLPSNKNNNIFDKIILKNMDNIDNFIKLCSNFGKMSNKNYEEIENFKLKENKDKEWVNDNLKKIQTIMNIDEYLIVPMLNSEELVKEGNDMGHCVGGYSKECFDFDSFIYSIRTKKNELISTIEFNINEKKNSFIINQHKSYKNKDPELKIKKIGYKLCEYLNSLDIVKDIKLLKEEIEEKNKEKEEDIELNYQIAEKTFTLFKDCIPHGKESIGIEDWLQKMNLIEAIENSFLVEDNKMDLK